MKMADFKNHRRFLLRCLSIGITPVSIKLKCNVKTPKGIYIVRKAEKMLMNERVRLINNTIIMLNCQINMCINDLKSRINKEDMENCCTFINQKRREKTLQIFRETKRQIQLIVTEIHRWPPKHPTWQGWV